MSFNLRNRSLLDLVDFSPRDIRYLIDLAAELKRAKAAGTEHPLWKQRIDQLMPYQVNAALMKATGKARTCFMHCLPAFHNLETEVGRQVHEKYGLSEIGVTDEVFESEASVVFTQAENRLHTIKAVLVATLS